MYVIYVAVVIIGRYIYQRQKRAKQQRESVHGQHYDRREADFTIPQGN